MIRHLTAALVVAIALVHCDRPASSAVYLDATDAAALAADPGEDAPACDRACHALYVAGCAPMATCPSACASAQSLGLVPAGSVECVAASHDRASAVACGGGFCK